MPSLSLAVNVCGVVAFFVYYSHLLVVFGGLAGLEAVVDADENLHVNDASMLFHHYLNTCPSQGSNTIRTEVCALLTWCVIVNSSIKKVREMRISYSSSENHV